MTAGGREKPAGGDHHLTGFPEKSDTPTRPQQPQQSTGEFDLFAWAAEQQPSRSTAPAKRSVTYVGGGVNPAYTGAAYNEEMQRLLGTSEDSHNRNDTLNDVTFRLARFVYSGDIP